MSIVFRYYVQRNPKTSCLGISNLTRFPKFHKDFIIQIFKRTKSFGDALACNNRDGFNKKCLTQSQDNKNTLEHDDC